MMRSQGTLKCRHDRNTVFAEETPRDRAVSALKDHHPPPPIHGNIMIPAYDRWKMPGLGYLVANDVNEAANAFPSHFSERRGNLVAIRIPEAVLLACKGRFR